MANWGNTDDAANSVTWAAAQVNLPANSYNQANLFGNTTTSSFITGAAVGQFGVDTTEMGVANGSIVSFVVTDPGTGYSANATVTVGGNGTANAQANSLGKIAAVNVVLPGNSYVTPPSVVIAAPTAKTFNANTGVDGTTEFISVATNPFVNGDFLTYTTSTGNTVVTGLTNAASYYAVAANSTGLKLALTVGGAAINIAPTAVSETGHNLTGRTATAAAVVSGASGKGFHAGWVLRTAGTGGRAGRVQYETLVAMGSITTASDAEDTIFKDA
jgi:hypothetical protein